MDTDIAAALSSHAKTVDLILPEINEDGRVGWAWSELIEIIRAG